MIHVYKRKTNEPHHSDEYNPKCPCKPLVVMSAQFVAAVVFVAFVVDDVEVVGAH